MRIVFFGGGHFAAAVLEQAAAAHEVVQVVTPPAAAAGRKMALALPPAAKMAEQLSLPLVHDMEVAALEQLAAQACVVCDYGRMLPPALLAAGGRMLNIHPSLLPRWRGAAPIERAVLAGDRRSGVTIMQMTSRLDAGPILAQWQMPIEGSATAGQLRRIFAGQGAALLLQVLAQPAGYPPAEQDEAQATYAHKITAACRRLDFTRAAEDCLRQVLAFAPAPGAYFFLGQERVRVLKAQVAPSIAAAAGTLRAMDGQRLLVACGGGGALQIDRLQRAGRNAVSAAEFLRGWRPQGEIVAG